MNIQMIPMIKDANKKAYEQLYEVIKQEILQGTIKYQDRLPSIRQCARQLQLSKTTIQHAYDKLVMEGYVLVKAQSGYYVDLEPQRLVRRQQVIAEDETKKEKPIRYDFRSSFVDASGFDAKTWLYYMKDALQDTSMILSYGDAQGEAILRYYLQKYIYAARGVTAHQKQIVVGSSFQSLLYLFCSLWDGKKCIAMEKDTFLHAEQVFRDCGFTIIYVESEQDGIRLPLEIAQKIGLLYINSASHGTHYSSLSRTQRMALLNDAKTYDFMILEDDHNGEIRYFSKIQPALQSFDNEERVVYMRSFSKLLIPSIRMSFMVLPTHLYQMYEKRKHLYHPSSSKIEQHVFAYYIRDGHLEKQVQRLKRQYEKKYQMMLEVLHRTCFAKTFQIKEATQQIYLPFPASFDLNDCIKNLQAQGIYVQKYQQGMAISFAGMEIKHLQEGMQELMEQVEKALFQASKEGTSIYKKGEKRYNLSR